MKRTIIILLVLINFTGCREEKKIKEINQNFDFESVEKYFEIIEKLKLNGKIDSTEWAEFLDLKGNRLYIQENNMSKVFGPELKSLIEQVYPSSDSLNEIRSEDLGYKGRYLYKKEEEEHKKHLKFLKNNQLELTDSIKSLSKRFIKKDLIIKDTFPKIYYHALDFDGSANDKGIFISIINAYAYNKERLGSFEAHELHHLQRNSLLENIKIEKSDQGLIWAIESVHNEGLADMIDKDKMLDEKSDWWIKKYLIDYYEGNGSEVLVELNKAILDEINNNHHSEKEYRALLLGSVGHVPGYLMAKTIKEQGKLNKIIQSSDNAFSFFKIYNSCAQENTRELPVFNKEVMEYINKLEEKYLK